MANQLAQDIPLGDLQLYDNYVPALDAGNWRIEITHTLAGIATDSLSATQAFVVSAPQFAFDPSAILSRYPPDGSAGRYGEVLPHIVLRDPLLPWERRMADADHVQPWLALLILQDNELIGGESSPTRTLTATVGDFLKPDSKILKTTAEKEDDIADTDPCNYIQISTTLFQSLTPRLQELRFLAHCRQANIADKAAQGLDENGLFSLVVANRFPAAPTAGAVTPLKNIAHLVSLEGLEPYLVDQPNFAGHDTVALVSLASWTFQSLPDNQEDFRGLLEHIVALEFDGANYHPENLWLQLPLPPLDASDPVQAEALERIKNGFVPLQYQTRTGEQTFAWYRGPVTPVLTTPLAKSGPFLTADSAIIYQSQYGMFDLSLAAAWEIGRGAALADKVFGQTLLDFRRRAHRLTDALLQRLQSDFFSQDQIASLDHDTTVQDEFLKVLDSTLLEDIGSTPAATPPAPADTSGDPPDSDPKIAVQRFLTDPDAQQKILGLVKDDLDPIATWLARLLLLYPVPFNLLVPDTRMLDVETLRFFHVDDNWQDALLDGALSIGMESSRETFFYTITHDLIHRSAFEAAHVLRSRMVGVEPPAAEVAKGIISGLLLRSAVVSGWPNLAVRPYLNDGTLLKILRMDHLSSSVLLCLFWGVPDYVEISEPQEGFRFGVDDDGRIPLRQPVPPARDGDPPLGSQLANTFQVRAALLRSPDSRVLNLAPDSPDGLIQKLQAALPPVADFGPSDFALQMVKSPEAIKFASQTS